jgi:hypothetical protein
MKQLIFLIIISYRLYVITIIDQRLRLGISTVETNRDRERPLC